MNPLIEEMQRTLEHAKESTCCAEAIRLIELAIAVQAAQDPEMRRKILQTVSNNTEETESLPRYLTEVAEAKPSTWCPSCNRYVLAGQVQRRISAKSVECIECYQKRVKDLPPMPPKP